MPIFLRISSNSAREIAAMSWPFIQICPALGFSRPTNVRSSVLLPEPEPPRITSVSERATSKLMPWRISCSPYCTRRSFTEITGSVCETSFLSSAMPTSSVGRLLTGNEKENSGENEIDGDHRENGDDHGLRCGPPDLLRPSSCGKALV